MRDYEFYYTQDGSVGLYSYADEDVYHSKFGALSEAWDKFIQPSGIDKKLNTVPNIKVLDVCYGIGYNTKALMSYVINTNENYLNRNNFSNKIKKYFKKIKIFNKKIFGKNNNLSSNIEAIDNDNINVDNNKMLLTSIETNNNNCSLHNEHVLSNIKIDCLEINEELVKLSPLIKTFITPQEIFTRIIPKIFDCFDTYWKIKKILSKIGTFFAPKNNREITELLDIKFNNTYDELEYEHRIHKFVNYILANKLVEIYGKEYLNTNFKKVLKNKRKRRFFEPALLKYIKFKLFDRYNLLSKFNLIAFLHNIYYDHLSNRYKKAKFEDAESLFNINFYINDARKSILQINDQYDLIFLDAFTFSKAPELWTVEFMAELYNRLSSRGLLMTYSNSALVRNTFIENNFYIGKILDSKTGKCIGTIAAKDKSMIEHPLSNYDLGLCSTRAGIPYRDPGLSATKEQILKRRELDFKSSDLMTSSQYMRSRTAREDDNNEE